MPQSVDGWLTGVGNLDLYWQGWLPEVEATGVVLICHGAAEHSGRYVHVAEELVANGWAVYAMDLRGHGRSAGVRVHIERYTDFTDDFDNFRRQIVELHPGRPVFLLGHSMGGQIALAYALDHQDVLQGLILSAPFLAIASVPKVLRPMAKFAARLSPTARIKLADLSKISQDPQVVKLYDSDPLVHHEPATLAFGIAASAQFDALPERSRMLRLPLLIQHGTDDQIADPAGTRKLDSMNGSPDQTLYWYDGLWHEIYNEPERHRPIGDLVEWLAERR